MLAIASDHLDVSRAGSKTDTIAPKIEGEKCDCDDYTTRRRGGSGGRVSIRPTPACAAFPDPTAG